MKITTEPLEDCQLSLTIELSEERIRKAKRQVARQVSKDVKIPGFRKGKAPYSAIAQRYGWDAMKGELIDHLGEPVFREAVQQEDIDLYGTGVLTEAEIDPPVFKFTVPLRPQVDLGDYRSYRREFPSSEVTEEEIERELEKIRQQNAILAPLDRPAVMGDLIEADVVLQTPEGEVVLEREDFSILLDAESGFIPGFAEAVEGMEAGDERTFTLTMPDDFWQQEWQGQDIECDVDVLGVYERILPGIDDDLARTAGNFDSLDELKDDLRRKMQESKRARVAKEYREAVVEDITNQAEINYPPVMLEESLDDVVERYEQAVKQEEHMSLDDYLRIEGKTMDDLRQELEPGTRASIEQMLILGEIIQQEGIEVKPEEIKAELDRIVDMLGEKAAEARQSLNTLERQKELRSRILTSKARKRLVAIAKGEAPEIAPSEEFEDTEEFEGLEEFE